MNGRRGEREREAKRGKVGRRGYDSKGNEPGEKRVSKTSTRLHVLRGKKEGEKERRNYL